MEGEEVFFDAPRLLGGEGGDEEELSGYDDTWSADFFTVLLTRNTRRGLRYSDGPGAVGSLRCQRDDDLYPCVEPGR